MFGSAAGDGELFFGLERTIEVGADALELRGPGGEGIGLVVIEHVAHGEAEGIEIVLHAKELKGVATIVLDEIVLQLAQARDLQRDVPGIGYHGGDGDNQAERQAGGWRTLRRARHGVKDITPERRRTTANPRLTLI